jgi:predicted RNA-binding protein YlqC (UPF0109 family)
MRASRAADLLGFVVRGLVKHPEEVAVTEFEDERSRVLKLKVHPEDLGRVIGKEGRTAQAIRNLLQVATGQDSKTAKLDILD